MTKTHRILAIVALLLIPQSALAGMRVVSTGICADQWLLALADHTQIAGLSKQAIREDFSAYSEEAQGLPSHNGSAEQIVALKPDLILADAFTRRATLATLERIGIKTIKIPPAETLAQWQELLHHTGAALGQEQKAAALEKALLPVWQKLARATPPTPVPLAAIYRPNGYSPGISTLPNDTLKLLGMRNLSAELGMNFTRRLPLETLVYHAPDYLILDTEPERADSLAALTLSHRGLEQFSEHTKKVSYRLSAWFCLSPRSLPAAVTLGHEMGANL